MESDGCWRWLSAVGLLCTGASLLCALQAPVNDDDVYHLHSIWLFGQGAVPYREFFEIHPPGMWQVLGPVSRLFDRPSAFLLAARAFTAVVAGLIFALAGAVVQVRGLRAAVLAAFGLAIISQTRMWMFRAEYFATLLLMLHLCLLVRAWERRGGAVAEAVAAVPLGLACTMSVRMIPFLAVQPIAVLLVRRGALRRAGLAWAAGAALGALPSALYVSAHALWPALFQWVIRFPASGEVVSWGLAMDRGEWALIGFGLGALTVLAGAGVLSAVRLRLVGVAWAVAVAFHLANPQRIHYAAVHVLLLTGMALAAAVSVIAPRQPPWRRSGALIAVSVGLIFYLRMIWWIPLPIAREGQAQQLRLLDWLAEVAAGQPVVLIPPYHPMLVRDATDLQNPAQFAFWIGNEAVRARLGPLAAAVLERPPPVLAADPWPEHTGGMDLVDWLRHHRVLSADQAASLRDLLRREYALIGFPSLSGADIPAFGHRFWVRRDRLGAAAPPGPFRIADPDR